MDSEITQKAFDAHKSNNPQDAIPLYQQALEQFPKDKRLYINLGALLRSQGQAENAAQILQQGLIELNQESPAILNNLGNSLRDLSRYTEAASVYIRALKANNMYLDAEISLYTCYKEMGLYALAKLQLSAINLKYKKNKREVKSLLISHEIEEATREGRDLNLEIEALLEDLNEKEIGAEKKHPPIHWFSASIICASRGKVNESMKFYVKGVSALKLYSQSEERSSSLNDLTKMYNIHSWNLSCNLLRAGDFKNGWRLFDHGLRCPAEGAQRWQRSLFKPASSTSIPIWKGENLRGKHLLLLGEQGIGDSMQFLVCIHSITRRAKSVTLILPDRIQSIYKRSLPNCNVYGIDEVRKSKVSFLSSTYDYQSPLGSIIQYEIQKPEQIGKESAFLRSRPETVSRLRNQYYRGKPIVGISWQGGGRGKRLKEKSLDLELLCKSFRDLDYTFLSLQYGDDAKIVQKAANKFNIDFIDDPQVQAMKDMELWLDQVECCDYVVSIANTTIHGAGGLGKPTICLLGQKPDWRWLKNPSVSYWYPCVSVSNYNEKTGWKSAVQEAKQWLLNQTC